MIVWAIRILKRDNHNSATRAYVTYSHYLRRSLLIAVEMARKKEISQIIDQAKAENRLAAIVELWMTFLFMLVPNFFSYLC